MGTFPAFENNSLASTLALSEGASYLEFMTRGAPAPHALDRDEIPTEEVAQWMENEIESRVTLITQRVEDFSRNCLPSDLTHAAAFFLGCVIDLCAADAAAVFVCDETAQKDCIRGARAVVDSLEPSLVDLLFASAIHLDCVQRVGRALTHASAALTNEVLLEISVTQEPMLQGTELQRRLIEAEINTLSSRQVRTLSGRVTGVVWLMFRERHSPQRHGVRVAKLLLDRLTACVEQAWLEVESAADRARLTAILESVADSIVSIDPSGIIRTMNPATLQMFGFSESELLGQPISMLIPATTQMPAVPATARPESHHARTVLGTRSEFEARRKDGTLFPIELVASEIKCGSVRGSVGGSGGGLGFAVDMRDMTHVKTVEAQIRTADRLAAIGTLAAGLGHDMNNVLFPIRAHLQALADSKPVLTAKQRRAQIGEIVAGVSYLQHLADSLHFVALDPQSEPEEDCSACSDLEAWWEVAGALLTNALHHKAQFTVTIEPNLPLARISMHALTRAMLNLLVNAAEAMPEGRPFGEGAVRLNMRRSSRPCEVILEVVDNGVGMSDEVRRRALNLFFTTKLGGLGTGLGLPLVSGVVERVGGTLAIESRVGAGTTVRVTVPAETADAIAQRSQRVSVEIHDARLATMVRGLLDMRGDVALIDSSSTRCRVSAMRRRRADIWVVAAPELVLTAARVWLRSHESNQMVVLGPLTEPIQLELEALGVTLVADASDIEAIGNGLDRAGNHQTRTMRRSSRHCVNTNGIRHE